jgi:hypothetical protein
MSEVEVVYVVGFVVALWWGLLSVCRMDAKRR